MTFRLERIVVLTIATIAAAILLSINLNFNEI